MKKAAAFCLILLTLTLCVVLILNRVHNEATGTARDAIDLFKSVLNLTPEVKITSYVTVQKTSEILELSTVKKEMPVETRYSSRWGGSEKVLVLRGQYTVKAGFDLRDEFTLEVDEKTQVIHAHFPQPKVLSVQLDNESVSQSDNGWWNKLSQQDHADAVNQMTNEARTKATELNILSEARKSLQTQIEELAKKKGQKWEITFRGNNIP